MVKACEYVGCKNRQRSNSNINFHRYVFNMKLIYTFMYLTNLFYTKVMYTVHYYIIKYLLI